MEDKQNIIRGRYKVIQEISRGGMGVVYLALDLLKNREVAVKKSFFAAEKQAQKGFEIEAKLLARLDHEGLPKVLDYFLLEDNYQALVMDFIGGETLADVLESGKFRVGRGLDSAKILDWTIQILDILRYLHNFEPPIVHRDIKPNNIKLTREGKIILLDFGLAKGTAITVVGGMSGYSPIEQVNRTGTDPRSDIYALGTTLFHLLANEYPLTALDRFREIYGQTLLPKTENKGAVSLKNDPQKTVFELNSQVPLMVSEIVMKAISLLPENRFQSADEMKFEVLKAKRSLEYGISKVGAITNFNDFTNSEKQQSLIDANEENLTIWKSQKREETPQIEEKVSGNNSFLEDKTATGNELQNTAASSDLFGKSFERELTRPSLLPDLSLPHSVGKFEISAQNLEQNAASQPIKKRIVQITLGAVAIILLTSFGIFVWYLLAKPKNSATEILTAKTSADSTLILPKKEETAKNPLQISKYGIGKNGKFFALEENYQFAENEHFKLGVTSPQAGFLYIISRDNQAKAILAYPKPNQDNFTKQNAETVFPQDVNFELKKNTPSETWVYFVVVSSREDDLAKRIRKILDTEKEKSLSILEVNELFTDLDKLAEDSAKNKQENADLANKSIVGIIKLQKKI